MCHKCEYRTCKHVQSSFMRSPRVGLVALGAVCISACLRGPCQQPNTSPDRVACTWSCRRLATLDDSAGRRADHAVCLRIPPRNLHGGLAFGQPREEQGSSPLAHAHTRTLAHSRARRRREPYSRDIRLPSSPAIAAGGACRRRAQPVRGEGGFWWPQLGLRLRCPSLI